jgi:hypothetical protein
MPFILKMSKAELILTKLGPQQTFYKKKFELLIFNLVLNIK